MDSGEAVHTGQSHRTRKNVYNISYLQDYLGVSPLGALRLTIGSLFAPSTPEFGAAEEAAIAREKKRRKRLSGGGPATDNSSNCAELSAK